MSKKNKNSSLEQCDDYAGYKKGNYQRKFIYKCGQVIWPEDEKLRHELKLYDEAHSNDNNISDKSFDKLDKELKQLAKEGPRVLCRDDEKSIMSCISNSGRLHDCHREMEGFLECLDSTVKEIYADDCQRREMLDE